MSRYVSPSTRLVLGLVVLVALALVVVGRTDLVGTVPSASPPAASEAVGAVPSFEATFSEPSSQPTQATGSTPIAPTSACRPTEQDRYVYNPDRLEVRAACIHVAGIVEAIRTEADGDLHILLNLDAPYRHLLTAANRGQELGDLVVEPVCVHQVTQLDAMATCAADPDPLSAPFPVVGQHVWMEGRYVLDLDHGGWAELHPLYRWGP